MEVQNLQSPVAIARFRSRLRKATPVFSSSDAVTQQPPSIQPTDPTPTPCKDTAEPQIAPEIVENLEGQNNIETPVTAEEPQIPKTPVIIHKFAKPQPKIADVVANPQKQVVTAANTISSSDVGEASVGGKIAKIGSAKTLARREREKLPREKKSNRKKFKKGENPEKTKMTMFDWIYWNPDTEPMTYKEAEMAAARAQDAESASNASANTTAADDDNVDLLAEDEDGNEDKDKEDDGNDEESIPVPQVMIGPDGNIIIDEKSLMIPSLAATNNRLKDAPVVYEDGHTTYASFSKRKGRKTKWSHKETMKFYSALSTVGTDFSLMLGIFPEKSRHELRLKFKREEKLHKVLVERAISDGQQFDLSIFETNGSESDASAFDDSDAESENVNGKTKKQTANKHKETSRKRRYTANRNKLNGNASTENTTENASTENTAENTSNENISNENNCTANENTGKDKTKASKTKAKRARRKAIVEDDSDFCDSDHDTAAFNSATTSSVSSEKDSAYEATILDMTNAMRSAVSGSLVADAAEEVGGGNGGVLDFDVNNPVGSLMEDSRAGEEEEEKEEENEDGNEEEEVIESLLKKTRYGRQPKRRAVFTVVAPQPKKKLAKTDENKNPESQTET